MVELRWIQASLVLVLMLHVTGQNLHVTVREGDDVTLNCGNVIKHQDQCKRTTWMISGSSTVPLFEHGKIHEAAKSRSNRLSLTEKCSLVINKVTRQDAGLYFCRPFDGSGRRQGGDSMVDLSVVSITRPFYRFTVRRGDDVTLPCGNVIHDQDQCDKTTWMFSGSGRSSTVTLFESGRIHEAAASKPVRLRVTEKCSLVVEKVTRQDEGLYICRQFDGSGQIVEDALVDLSVVSNSEHQDTDEVTLSCSVVTHGPCRHTVKWLDETNTPSQSSCAATGTFTTSQLQTFSDSLMCEVTDGDGRKQTFPFRRQTSGEDAKKTTKQTPPPTTTTSPTTMTATTTSSTTTSTTSTPSPPTSSSPPPPEPSDVVSSTSSSDPTKPQGDTTGTKPSAETTSTDPDPHTGQSLRFIIVAVGVAALLITVIVIVWKKLKGNQTRADETTADPEGGVRYASIRYSTKLQRKAWGNRADDDDDDAVTDASCSSPGASTDPNLLYATINKP